LCFGGQIYSDECSFNTFASGTTWVTRLRHERYHDQSIYHDFQNDRASVIVCGAISYNWKSPLIFLDGTGKRGVQVSDYLDQVLGPMVAPAFRGLLGHEGYRAKQEEDEEWGLYVEDHASVHGTKKALVEAKRVLEIPLHERPSSSPDLNPIENVWSILNQRIKQRSMFLSTLSGMNQAVQEEWDKLQPSDFNKYIDSVSERIDQLRQRKGMQTQY
jgi:transposase